MQRLLERAEELSGFEYDISSYADIVQAIHVIQDEMGITGTTAKEAGTTISGALSAAGAAWKNILTGVADENADFEKLIGGFVVTLTGDGTENNSGVFGTLLPRIETALSGIGKLVQKLVPVAIDMIPGIISDTLPKLISSGAELLKAIGQGIMDNLGLLADAAVQTVVDLGNFIGDALPELIPAVINVITKIVDILTDEQSIERLIDAALKIVVALADGLLSNLPTLIAKVPEIIINLVNAILDKAPDIAKAGEDIISSLFDNMPEILTNLATGVVEIADGIIEQFKKTDWSAIGDSILGGLGSVFEGLDDIGAAIYDLTHPEEEEPSSGGGSRTGGSSRGGRREPSIVQNNYFTAPYDANEQSKADEKLLNTLAYGQ